MRKSNLHLNASLFTAAGVRVKFSVFVPLNWSGIRTKFPCGSKFSRVLCEFPVRDNVSFLREGNVCPIVKMSVNRPDKWRSDIGSGVDERTVAQDNWDESDNVRIT
jgi:hypothetical protein